VDFFSGKCSEPLDFAAETLKTAKPPIEQHIMKTIDQQKLEQIKAAALAVAPNAPLKGQGEVAKILRMKGYSVRAISRILGENDMPVSPTAITNYLRQEDTPA
jgi:hypothetical protein